MKSESIHTLVGAVTPLILSFSIFMTCVRAGVGNVMRAGTIKVSHSYTSPVGADCDPAQDAHRSSRSSFFNSFRALTNVLRTCHGKTCNASIIPVHLCVLIITLACCVRQVGHYSGSYGTYVLRLYVTLPSGAVVSLRQVWSLRSLPFWSIVGVWCAV
jgi:hypothetical protein